MSLVLGIDPGTQCGWALVQVSDGETKHYQRLGSGVFDLRTKRHEGAGMRYARFRSSFHRLLVDFGEISHVAYEEVRRHAGTSAAHVYGGITAVLQEVCESMRVPYLGVPVGQVKKRATGKGNASKEAMVAAAREAWPGANVKTTDEADALWIAVCGLEEVGR